MLSRYECEFLFNLFFPACMLLVLVAGCDRTVAPKQSAGQSDPQATEQTAQRSAAFSNSLTTTEQSPAAGVDSRGLPLAERLPRQNPGQSELPTAGPALRTLSIQQVKSDDPQTMTKHLAELDRAIEDLLQASGHMEEKAARESAIALARMKLTAGEHLAALAQASTQQVKLGTKAQLIALSHLSGLKDVQAAKQLSQLAVKLLDNADPELRHQGQVVLFGFKIQELQNGILPEPDDLVRLAQDLLADPQFRGRLEMTSLAHATDVMRQMGYAEQAAAIQQCVFKTFAENPDRQLRKEAWNQLVGNSQSLDNFLGSLQALGTEQFDPVPVLAAARGLLMKFPNPVTLEMIAGLVTDIEYSGNVALSAELTQLIDTEIEKYPSGYSADVIRAALVEHRQRMDWLGRELVLEDLVDAQNTPLDLSRLKGKVLLVDFWATWCPPCLKEIPHLRQAQEQLSAQDFAVISINMDQEPERLTSFLESNPVPWPTYRPAAGNTKAITDQFGITLFPFTFLVDQEGRVVSLHVRGESIVAQAQQLIKR